MKKAPAPVTGLKDNVQAGLIDIWVFELMGPRRKLTSVAVGMEASVAAEDAWSPDRSTPSSARRSSSMTDSRSLIRA